MTRRPLGTSLLALGLLAALAAGAVWSLRPAPVEVEVAEVTRGPLVRTVLAEGITRVRAPWTVSAPIAGTLGRPPVEEGDAVLAGQTVVATLRPAEPPLLDARSRAAADAMVAEARAAVELAGVRLAQADEALGYADAQLARIRTLAERGTATQTQLEAALRDAASAARNQEAARSELELATASLTRAEVQLRPPGADRDAESCCLSLKAPLSGIVLSLAETQDRLVAAGTPILTIGDLADMQIEAEVLSTDAVRIRPGAAARIEGWGGETVLEARVARVDPAARTVVSALGIEEQRVTVTLDLLTPPDGRPGLGDRFRVFARITLWQADEALQAPLAALFRDGAGWAAYRIAGDRAERVAVTPGRMTDDAAEITAGLAEGDRLIVYPPDTVADGVAVTVRPLP